MKPVSRWAARSRRNQAQRRAALRFVGATVGLVFLGCWSLNRYEESKELAALRDGVRESLREWGAPDDVPALLIGRRSMWTPGNFEVAVHLGSSPDGVLATEEAFQPIPVADRVEACARFIDGIVNEESDDVLWSPFQICGGSTFVYARTADEERVVRVRCASARSTRIHRRIDALMAALGVREGFEGMEIDENR